MSAEIKDKKSSFAFSLTEAERLLIEQGIERHGFDDRNQYLLALLAADIELELEPVHDARRKTRVLQLSARSKWKVIQEGVQLGILSSKIDDPMEIAVAEAQADYKSQAAKSPRKEDRSGAA